MKRRRRSATARTLALAGVCASSLGAACAFVDVTYTDGGGGNVGDGPGGGTDGTVGAGGDAGSDGGVSQGADSGMDTGSSDTGIDGPADTGAPPDAGHDAAQDTGAPPMDSGGISDGPNCDCAASKLIQPVQCMSVLGIGCTGEGFGGSTIVPCGTTAQYYTCGTTGVLSCGQIAGGTMRQQCQ